MAAHSTGFPLLYTMGFWDKEHHMRLFVKGSLTCTGVFRKASSLVCNLIAYRLAAMSDYEIIACELFSLKTLAWLQGAFSFSLFAFEEDLSN